MLKVEHAMKFIDVTKLDDLREIVDLCDRANIAGGARIEFTKKEQVYDKHADISHMISVPVVIVNGDEA